jgi:hypothetical protein
MKILRYSVLTILMSSFVSLPAEDVQGSTSPKQEFPDTQTRQRIKKTPRRMRLTPEERKKLQKKQVGGSQDKKILPGVPTPQHIEKIDAEKRRQEARDKGLLPGVPTPEITPEMREQEQKRQEARAKGLLPGVPTPKEYPQDESHLRGGGEQGKKILPGVPTPQHIEKIDAEKRRQEARDKGLLPGVPTPEITPEMREQEQKRQEARAKGLLPGVPTPKEYPQDESHLQGEESTVPSARYKAHIQGKNDIPTSVHDFFVSEAEGDQPAFLNPAQAAQRETMEETEEEEGLGEEEEAFDNHLSNVSTRFLGAPSRSMREWRFPVVGRRVYMNGATVRPEERRRRAVVQGREYARRDRLRYSQ